MSDAGKKAATHEPYPGQLIFEHSIALIVVGLPTISVFFAIAGWTGRIPGWLEAALLIIFYFVSVLGITVGFHRHFTHRSFSAKPILRVFLAFAGSIAVQGPIIRWVADHRRHHQFADKLGDPHSPHVPFGHADHLHEREGLVDLLQGLWWAHIGWLFNNHKTTEHRYAADLLKDPLVIFFSRNYFIWMVVSFLLPAVIGFAVTLDWRAAVSCMLIAGFVRIFLVHHMTWAVNSLGHSFGQRPYKTGDQSTNIGLLSLPTLGDSYHNNHHAFPSSARHGIDAGQFDPGWWFIRLMQHLGLAGEAVSIPEALRQNKKVSNT
jgi:stearoyl-CoA desaturase (delta-9 desaturase)